MIFLISVIYRIFHIHIFNLDPVFEYNSPVLVYITASYLSLLFLIRIKHECSGKSSYNCADKCKKCCINIKLKSKSHTKYNNCHKKRNNKNGINSNLLLRCHSLILFNVKLHLFTLKESQIPVYGIKISLVFFKSFYCPGYLSLKLLHLHILAV